MKEEAAIRQPEAPAGTLIAVGGGLEIGALLELLLSKAGGVDAPLVVIPTAGGEPYYPPDWGGQRELLEVGARNVTVLHTLDPRVADTEEFVRPLREATGVWITGGRQWHLANAYLGTRVHQALWDIYRRGGVIGGTSAGATILGSYLARGDTQTNTIMMGDHEQGFGFLEDVAIDQHLLARNRHFDLLEIVRAKPHLLGIGIDENTAIVVRDGTLEVAGKTYVTIYDPGRSIDSGGEFYFLGAGDRLDLGTRRPTRGKRPLERVVERDA
ncbi:MAG: cyanophycinase [Planctomycetota bacterium]|nr:cyanophycinase [Planctomycetota bacterium]